MTDGACKEKKTVDLSTNVQATPDKVQLPSAST